MSSRKEVPDVAVSVPNSAASSEEKSQPEQMDTSENAGTSDSMTDEVLEESQVDGALKIDSSLLQKEVLNTLKTDSKTRIETLVNSVSNPSVKINNSACESKSTLDSPKNIEGRCRKDNKDGASSKKVQTTTVLDTPRPSTSENTSECGSITSSKEIASSSATSSNTSVPLSSDDPVVLRAYSLASFIVDNVTKQVKPKGKMEETLLRNVNHLLTKHSITFRAMMNRLNINKESGYYTFVTVANELFENDKKNITWSRIIALFAFGAQLALYCKEKGFAEYASNIGAFMGKYVADTLGPFVKEKGGWVSIVINNQ